MRIGYFLSSEEFSPCGPDPERQLEAIQATEDAGYIQQIGDEQERFFELYANEILPRFNDDNQERRALATEGAQI